MFEMTFAQHTYVSVCLNFFFFFWGGSILYVCCFAVSVVFNRERDFLNPYTVFFGPWTQFSTRNGILFIP